MGCSSSKQPLVDVVEASEPASAEDVKPTLVAAAAPASAPAADVTAPSPPAKVKRQLTSEQLEAREAAAAKRLASKMAEEHKASLLAAQALAAACAESAFEGALAQAAEERQKAAAAAAAAAALEAQQREAATQAEAVALSQELAARKPSEKAVEVWTKKLVMALSNKNAAGVNQNAKGTGIGVNAIDAAATSTAVLAQHFVRGADANKMLPVMGERQSPKSAAKRYKTTEALQAALDYHAAHKNDAAFVTDAWKLAGPE